MERDPMAPEVVAPAGPASSWAFFACAGGSFAVPLERVHEILPPQPLTRLPGCGPEVCGLIGVRGRVVTVFDLGVLAGSEPAAARPDHRLVLLRHGDRVVGLAVGEMVSATAPGEGVEIGRTGSVTVGGRVFDVLDPDRLLGPVLAR